MKKMFFAGLILFFSVVSFAQQPADKIIGQWENIVPDKVLSMSLT